jgi:hypothetical protein
MKAFFRRLIERVKLKQVKESANHCEERRQMQEVRERLEYVRGQLNIIDRRKTPRVPMP